MPYGLKPPKKIVVPSRSGGPRKNKKVTRKRAPSPVRLVIDVEEEAQVRAATLVFKRYYPTLTYPVRPIQVPLYWFTREMVDKKIILPIPPDTFVCDGIRFKVLAQDQAYVGRFSYTRWLVYEEAAVPKGRKP